MKRLTDEDIEKFKKAMKLITDLERMELEKKWSTFWDKKSMKFGYIAMVLFSIPIFFDCISPYTNLALIPCAVFFILYKFYSVRMLKSYIPKEELGLYALKKLGDDETQ